MYLYQGDFLEGLKKEKYQVYFLSSRVSIPFSLFAHTWIVTVRNGTYNRYDVWGWKNRGGDISSGYLTLNLYKPWVGVRIFPSKIANSKAARFKVKLLHSEIGEKESLAHQIVNYLDNNWRKYPYKDKYNLIGPNSNTFPQWVISKFPSLNFKLPWCAIGKNYKIN